MEYGFHGKAAVISGGSRGIGRAVARRLVQEGASVAFAGRTQESVSRAAEELSDLAAEVDLGGSVTGVAADLSTPEGVQALVDAALASLGGVDVLVNNVGDSGYGPLLQLSDETIMDAWELKTLGAIRLTRALVPEMEKRGGGAIVNISGGAGREPGPESLPAALANSGVRVFTRAMGGELARRGISINCITPGLVNTDRHLARAEQQARTGGAAVEQIIQDLDKRSPTGHVTTPEEVAELVLFLASRRVYNLTGAEIILDGGSSRSL
jgi:3-oxoacyl-[acyl-carrier protein] reductase/bacilysin biosynthesis oxidoreductase BacG